MHAIQVRTAGGPEVLRIADIATPEPGEGQVLVRIEAAGVNFIDVYHRTGFYPLPLPFTPGQEGAGVVERVGPGVVTCRTGDRVGFAGVMGAYAEFAVVPAERLVPLPEDVSGRDAAAVLLQGLTAHYLATTTFPLAAGQVCLVHAAAGGVGLLLVQIAELRGARVIGTVGTEEKAQAARRAGADDVIVYTRDDVVQAVRRLTNGRGVNVVYDGVGQATLTKSLECLARRGTLVSFGQASGPAPPVDPLTLSRHGSLYLTRPVLADHIATREELLARAGDVLRWVAGRLLAVQVHGTYALADAPSAHRELESRRTVGKVLLTPG